MCPVAQSARAKDADGKFYRDIFLVVLQGVQCCNVGDSERCELCGPPLVLDR